MFFWQGDLLNDVDWYRSSPYSPFGVICCHATTWFLRLCAFSHAFLWISRFLHIAGQANFCDNDGSQLIVVAAHMTEVEVAGEGFLRRLLRYAHVGSYNEPASDQLARA